jgi:hypothetical protein
MVAVASLYLDVKLIGGCGSLTCTVRDGASRIKDALRLTRAF